MREIPAAAGNPPSLCGFASHLCYSLASPVASGGPLSLPPKKEAKETAKGNRVVARGNGRYPAFGRIPARFPRLLLLKSKRLLRFEKDVSPESIRCWPIRLTPDIPANKDADSLPDDQGGSAPIGSPTFGRGTGVWTELRIATTALRSRNDGEWMVPALSLRPCLKGRG